MPAIVFQEQSNATVKVSGRDQSVPGTPGTAVGPTGFPPPAPPPGVPLALTVTGLGGPSGDTVGIEFSTPVLFQGTGLDWTVTEKPGVVVNRVIVIFSSPDTTGYAVEFNGLVDAGDHLVIPAGGTMFVGADGGQIPAQTVTLVE